MRKNAQASMEFMTVIGLLIFMATMAQVLVFGKSTEAWQLRTSMGAQDICSGVANELNLAGYSEGRSAYFTIPREIVGANYTLTVWDDYVAVDYASHACLSRFTALEVRNGGASPPFNLTGGTYRINTTQGVVTLEKMS